MCVCVCVCVCFAVRLVLKEPMYSAWQNRMPEQALLRCNVIRCGLESLEGDSAATEVYCTGVMPIILAGRGRNVGGA